MEVPGLNTALTRGDLIAGGNCHSGHPVDEPPELSEEHKQKLNELFVKHGAHKVLGIHVPHRHFDIPKCTVLLGTNYDSPCYGRLAQITAIRDIDVRRIRVVHRDSVWPV